MKAIRMPKMAVKITDYMWNVYVLSQLIINMLLFCFGSTFIDMMDYPEREILAMFLS